MPDGRAGRKHFLTVGAVGPDVESPELVAVEEFGTPDPKFQDLQQRGLLIDIENLAAYERSFAGEPASLDASAWKGRRVLITGAGGMVGSTIADLLVPLGAEVTAVIRRHATGERRNLQHHLDGARPRVRIAEADLRDSHGVTSLLAEAQPHVIFHQASESFVPTSIAQPAHVTENNCVSTVNVLEASRKVDCCEAIQLACSSEQLGFVASPEELPIRETAELRPTSTYAATKVFTEHIGRAYYYMYGTPTVLTRTFNQEGPRRPPQFFTGGVANQVAMIQKGKSDRLVIGNPDSVRDFTHITDSSVAQVLATEKCQRAEPYHICSGWGIRIGDYARLALRVGGLEGKARIFIDRSRLRPYERKKFIDGFIGDNTKFRTATGWRPTRTVLDIIRDGVAYYTNP